MYSSICDIKTRWPHVPPKNIKQCGPMGCVITGRSTPDYNVRYDNPYQQPASRNMAQCGPLGRVITGRSTPDYNVRYDNPYQQPASQNMPVCQKYGSSLSNTYYDNPPVVQQENTSAAMESAPQKLPLDAGSVAIGVIIGILGGAFVYTLTGRQLCAALGKRAKRRIDRR